MRGLCTFSSSFSRFPCFPIFLRIDVNGGSLEALSPDDSHTYSRVEARPACEQRHVRDQNASCNLRSRSWAGKQETRYRPHAESSSHCLLQLRAKFPVLNVSSSYSEFLYKNSNFGLIIRANNLLEHVCITRSFFYFQIRFILTQRNPCAP